MINVGLVGCGRIAKKHADLLSTNQIPGAFLGVVCDTNEKKAKEFGTKYKVPYYFDMFKMMEEHKDINLISVLTESGNHANHVIKLAEYGKHILVEKPMALTLDDADEMIKACVKNNIQLFVVKQNRFNIPVQKLRQVIETKELGKLTLGTIRVRWCRTNEYYNQDEWRGTWALDGGVLANQASHHIDLLQWMMGDVVSVFAKSITAGSNIEVEDTVTAILKFKNGALGVIEATTATRPVDLEGSISILGTKGTVEIGGFAVNEMKVWNFIGKEDSNDVIKKYSTNPPNVYGFGHQAYYDHVVNCINNKEKPMVDGFEGRKVLELILALYESIETGQEVFLRFIPKKCKLGIS